VKSLLQIGERRSAIFGSPPSLFVQSPPGDGFVIAPENMEKVQIAGAPAEYQSWRKPLPSAASH
jgi:hypothetical protein